MGCRVPIHLHGTACGWSNARGITNPQNAQEEEWKRQWEEATVHWYGQQPVRKTPHCEYCNDVGLLGNMLDTIECPHCKEPVRKTLDECKDEVAMEKGFSNWKDLLRHQMNFSLISRDSDEANRRFFSQAKAVEPQQELIRYDIDFGGNVMAGIEAVGEIKIIGAMDGYGNGIPVDKINVTKTNN